MSPEPLEPDRIDVGLHLFDQGGTRAVTDLVTQLQTISQQLQEVQAPTAAAAAKEQRRTGSLWGKAASAIRSLGASTGSADDAQQALREARSASASSAQDTLEATQAATQRLSDAAGQGASRGDTTYEDEITRRQVQAAMHQDLRPAAPVGGATRRARLKNALGEIGRAGGPRQGVDRFLDMLTPPAPGTGGTGGDPDFEYVSGQGGHRATGQRSTSNISIATQQEIERLRDQRSQTSEGGGASRPPNDRGGGGPPQGPGEEGGASSGDSENNLPTGPRGPFKHLRGLDINEPIQIPRYGEFTIQDKLNMASDWLARSGLRSRDRAGIVPDQVGGTGYSRLQTAALLNQASAYSPYAIGFGHSIMNQAGIAPGSQGPFGMALNFQENQQMGAQMGYPQQGGAVHPLGWTGVPFLQNVGFNLPGPFRLLTAAGRAGFSTQADVARMAARPEIDTQQAQALEQGMIEQGWVNPEDRRRMVNTTIGAYQLPGLSKMAPQAFQSLADQSMRWGTTSMNDFLTTLRGVPGAAHSARISIDEMLSGMNEVGQASEQQGGTYFGGIRRAQEVTRTSAIPPQVQAQLMQNPMVQGIMFQQTGLIPQLQAQAPGASFNTATMTSLRQLVNMYSGMPTTTIRDPGHLGATRISGSQQAIGLAAEQLGISPQMASFMMAHSHQIEAQGQLATAAQGYAQAAGSYRRRGGNFRAPGYETDTKDPNTYSFADLQKLMSKSGFTTAERRKVQEGATPEARRARLMSILDKHTEQQMGRLSDQSGTPAIDLTNRAAQLVKILNNGQSDLKKGLDKVNRGQGSGSDVYRYSPGTGDPRLGSGASGLGPVAPNTPVAPAQSGYGR